MPERSTHYVKRPLDTNEAYFNAYNSVGAYLTTLALELEGPLSEDLLLKTLAHLQERHPLLRARIVETSNGPEWQTPPAVTAPVLRVIEGETSSLEQVAETELHRGYLPAQEPLWRCTFAPGQSGNPHRIWLSVHHAAADGMSGLVLISDLFATCAALADGTPPPLYLPALPPLDEVLTDPTFAERGRRWLRFKLRRLAPPPGLLPLESFAPAERRRTRVLFRTLPGKTVSVLRELARQERSTLTGAFAAALLEATRETLGPLKMVPLNCPVNLREHGIPKDQLGSFTGNIHTRHCLLHPQPFWEMARNATRQLRAGLHRGDFLAALRADRASKLQASEEIRRMANDPKSNGREGALALSSRGRWPDPSAGPFRLRALYPATSNHTIGNCIQVSCGTVGETLFGCLVFVEPLFSEPTGRAFAQQFWAALEREAGSRRLGL